MVWILWGKNVDIQSHSEKKTMNDFHVSFLWILSTLAIDRNAKWIACIANYEVNFMKL